MRVVTESLSVLAARVRNGRVLTAAAGSAAAGSSATSVPSAPSAPSAPGERLAPRRPAVPDVAPAPVPPTPQAPVRSPWRERPPDRGEVARLMRAGAVAGLVAVVGALALSTGTELWLDEAQTVDLARLPPADLLAALRTDGAPPLYYLLLHAWIEGFGSSALAARALSGLFAAAAVALVPLAALRVGSRRAAVGAVALLASSPFLLRYATEARMYTLVVLLCVAGFIVLHAALERPDRRALAGVAVVTGLLLLTHYWSLFLLAAVAAAVAVRARREPKGGGARRVLAGMAAGSLLLVPWLPTFVFQLGHTGAPWGRPAGVEIFDATLQSFVGGRGKSGLAPLVFAGLALLGLCGRRLARGRIELQPLGRRELRPLAAVAAGALAAAMAVSVASGNAFAPRYAAVVFVPFVLLVAAGVATLGRRAGVVVLVALVAFGLVRSGLAVSKSRTQAPVIAAMLERHAQPGDVVAFCPDQLAPAVVRLVSRPLPMAAFPGGDEVSRVDWVDYNERARMAKAMAFVRTLERLAGPEGDVWLAWSPGYHGMRRPCEKVFSELRSRREWGTQVVVPERSSFESTSLFRFPPAQTD